MKLCINKVCVSVYGVRPVMIAYKQTFGQFFVTSPSCEKSRVFPESIFEVRQTLGGAYKLCKMLVNPLTDNVPADARPVSIVGIRYEVIDSLERSVGFLDYWYNSPESEPSSARVTFPSLNVVEWFSNSRSALSFCRYLCSEVSRIDIEADIRKC